MWVWWYNWRYYALHPWTLLKDIRRNLKWMWQRAWRGWSDDWGWDVHHILSEIIPTLMEELKNWGNSVPCSLYVTEEELEDTPTPQRMFGHANHSMRDRKDPDEDLKYWHSILDEIAEGFRAAQRMSDGLYLLDEHSEEFDKRYPGMAHLSTLFDKEAFEKWKEVEKDLCIKEREAELYKADLEKFNRAFELLHSYYFDLWD
jgi:hypothetical protein